MSDDADTRANYAGRTWALREVVFRETADPRFPFEAEVDGAIWRVRLDEFPEAPSLYSLFVDGEVVTELSDWPRAWIRLPAADPTDDPHERAEYERELRHAAHVSSVLPSGRAK